MTYPPNHATVGCRAFFSFASPSLFSKICLVLPDFVTSISPRFRRISADFMPKLTSAGQILKASTLCFTVKACKRAKIQYVKFPTQNALGRRRVKRGFSVLCAPVIEKCETQVIFQPENYPVKRNACCSRENFVV